MSIIGMASKANAQTTPGPTYYETPNHCKLINNQTAVVINYTDTVPIDGFDTITRNRTQKIACKLCDGHSYLIYNIDYYRNNSWVPRNPQQPEHDTVMIDMLTKDWMLAHFYVYYDRICDEHARDSVEMLLLKNRDNIIQRAKTYQK